MIRIQKSDRKRIPWGLFPVVMGLAWPTMLEQLLQTAVQYVDTAMVGSLGTDAVAATGATTTVNWLIFSTVSAVGVAALAAGVAAVGVGAASEGKIKQGDDAESQLQMMGSYQLNQWNYKETIVSTFDWETLQCERCSRVSNCESTSGGLFKSASCAAWADPVETCKTVQF
jgi:hypothetical protein